MDDSNLFDDITWCETIGNIAEIEGNMAAVQHLVYRFLGQYLPALLAARTQPDRDRVWYALWSYLTAPVTRSKNFSLPYSSADELIAKIQDKLASLGYESKG